MCHMGHPSSLQLLGQEDLRQLSLFLCLHSYKAILTRLGWQLNLYIGSCQPAIQAGARQQFGWTHLVHAPSNPKVGQQGHPLC